MVILDDGGFTLNPHPSHARNVRVRYARFVVRKIIPRNGPTGPFAPTAAAISRTVGSRSASASESESAAAAAFREALRHSLSSALRGEGALAGVGCCCCSGGLASGGGAGGGASSRAGVGVSGCCSSGNRGKGCSGKGWGVDGDCNPQLQSQQQQQQQQRHRPLLRSTSGSGLRQLASPFTPLVLDRGAVVSLRRSPRPRPPLPPDHARPSHGHPCYRDGTTCSGSPLRASIDDFVVELTSEKTAGVPGFPPPPQTAVSAAAGPVEGPTAPGAAGAIEYAVLACQEDVEQAAACAVFGDDVFAAEVHGAVVPGEDDGGGVGVVLGGVEEQASDVEEMTGATLAKSSYTHFRALFLGIGMGVSVV